VLVLTLTLPGSCRIPVYFCLSPKREKTLDECHIDEATGYRGRISVTESVLINRSPEKPQSFVVLASSPCNPAEDEIHVSTIRIIIGF
jgi:hypothetical protein